MSAAQDTTGAAGLPFGGDQGREPVERSSVRLDETRRMLSLNAREWAIARRRLALTLALTVLVAIWAGGSSVQAAAAPPLESELAKLGSVPVRGVTQIALSPDGRRLAYVLQRGKKQAVFCDGRETGEYDAVRGLRFSPKGKRLGFTASRDNTWFLVIDGKQGDRYTSIVGPAFSPNGKHLAFVAGLGGQRRYMVCDGQPRMKYTAVGQEEPVFSPNSRHLAYEGRTSGASRRTTVRDPNRPPQPNEPPPSWVTPDGTEVDVHADRVTRTNFIVRDGKKGPRTNDVHSPVFSPNSKTLVYAARFAHKWFIVVDDRKAGKLYDEVAKPVFSPGGRKLAYAAKLDDKWFIVRGRKKQEGTFDGIRHLTFSPHGTHLAFAAQEGRTWFVVCDGKKVPQYDDIGWVGFSPDGNHLAYAARRGHNRWLMVTDGVEGRMHQRVLLPKHGAELEDKLRYVAIDGEARLVEVNWPTKTDWSNGLK